MQTTRPITLTERVIQQLRSEIADGVYPVGARLPTGKQLAERYGVSTAVIREVTEHLRSQGMIESRQGLGSTVRSRVSDAGFRLSGQAGADAADLAAIYELRLDLESAAAAMAARRRTDDDLRRMAELLGTLAAQLHDIDRGAESDTQFHVAVATATHNKYYQDLLQYLNLQLHHAVRTARGNSQQQPGLPEQVHGEHVAIFEAIRAADPEAARLAAAAHLRNAAARLGLPLRAAA